jgi:hypothetical protein
VRADRLRTSAKDNEAITEPGRDYVRVEVFTAVTIKNAVFWNITPCGSCKNRRFGGT